MNKFSIHCPHFPACSGCTLSERVDAPPVLAEMRPFFKERGLTTFPIHADTPIGWRCRAKLAVRGEAILGLYQKGTHIALDIPHCQVHHPAINEAANLLRRFIQEEEIASYNEETHQGLLRYVQLAVERATGKVQLTLVLNSRETRQWQKLWDAYPWHSIWLNINSRRDNVIFGKEWELFQGEPFLWEQMCNTAICYHPASFAQANPALFEKLILSLLSQMPPQSRVVEYYAGVGAIGLSIAKECHKVICCEANTQAEHCFALSKEKSEFKEKLSFVNARAEEQLKLMQEADVILVDPPRKGLGKPLLEALKQQKGTLFYISCGWDAFQRDCDALLSAGWTLQTAEGYVLFPGTDQLELLVRFEQ